MFLIIIGWGLLKALDKYEKNEITWEDVIDEALELCRDVPSGPIIVLVGSLMPIVAILIIAIILFYHKIKDKEVFGKKESNAKK